MTIQISIDQGWHSAWRADGKELYYITPGGRLMAVAVELGESFRAGIPEVLFDVPLRLALSYAYAPAADGQRFLVDTLPDATVTLPLNLVQNWTARVAR